jgi:hypothetical protein
VDGEHLRPARLGLIVFVVALFRLPTDWHAMWHQAINPAVPPGQTESPIMPSSRRAGRGP